MQHFLLVSQHTAVVRKSLTLSEPLWYLMIHIDKLFNFKKKKLSCQVLPVEEKA